VRVWARGGASVLAAGIACVLTWSLLSVVLPSPVTTPPPGPVLESVTPAQLAAMGVRLDSTLQPVELPAWVRSAGARLPSGILLGDDAEAAVRRSSGGVRAITERALAYATLTSRTARTRGPTIARRLVWTLVGTRAVAGSVGGLMQALWLVDARSGRQLVELTVLGPAPAGSGVGAAAQASGAGP